ncbi:HNH endonuclease, partial [Bacillus subtilis]
EVKEDWAKRLDLDNLVSLCNACHNKVHGGKGK